MNTDKLTSNETEIGVADSRTPVEISVIVPMYNEVENVELLVQGIMDTLRPLNRSLEVILVDDGSTDETLREIATAAEQHEEVHGLYLARNYGQSTALQAGFNASSGNIVVTLDGDLQNDPSDIIRLLEVYETTGVDVVCGWRKNRQDPLVRKFFSRIANYLISHATNVPLHDFGCTLKVCAREVLDRTQLYGELHRFLPALLAEVGADVKEIEVTHHPRRHGQSKYRLDRTFRVFLDLLMVLFFRRYIQRPLHVFGGIGIMALLPGLLILGYLTGIKLIAGSDIGERPLLTLGVLLVLVGVIMIGQGLLGEMINRRSAKADTGTRYYLRSTRRVEQIFKKTMGP